MEQIGIKTLSIQVVAHAVQGVTGTPIFRRLVALSGGFTRQDVSGGWIEDAGELVYDFSAIFSFALSGDKLEQATVYAQQIASWIKGHYGEDCVLLQVTEQASYLA